jgi:hypothetical protein
LFKEKHASKCEELDVLRVEVAELKSRSALLGACTSCPVLHAKIDEMHAYPSSLEAKLKEPIPTSCSTCEMHALKKLELAHYVDRLQDENDELRKLMGWLSGHEPQLRMMIEACKRQDGEGLGANKVGEGWFPQSGYRGGVRGGSFGRKDGLMCANPTFEQMARHWFYSFGTNPSAESFVRSRARF